MIQGMRSSVATVYDLTSSLTPADELEAEHQLDVVGWLRSTDDVSPQQSETELLAGPSPRRRAGV